MLSVLLTVIAVIVVFGLIVFFHELGHFLLAKRAGILVFEFALGFGPKLISVQWGETEYTLRAIPLGGFVRFAGMDPKEEEVDPARDYQHKSVWERMSVIAAGPLANFVLAAVLLAAIFLTQGFPTPTTTVGEVLPDRPAAEAGLQEGDRIVAVAGREVDTWEQLVAEISSRPDERLILTVDREGTRVELPVVPQEEAGVGKIGFIPQSEPRPVGPFKALAGGVERTVQFAGLITTFLGQMILGQAPADVGGPVRIVAEIGNAAQVGLIQLLSLSAFLSINVGLFNLLPIPALDGSRLLFLAWEGITRRPINRESESVFHLVGFALLLLLIAVITFKDISELIM